MRVRRKINEVEQDQTAPTALPSPFPVSVDPFKNIRGLSRTLKITSTSFGPAKGERLRSRVTLTLWKISVFSKTSDILCTRMRTSSNFPDSDGRDGASDKLAALDEDALSSLR